LETDTLSSTKKFDLRWGPGDDEVINWKILADGEHITEDPLDVPNSVDYVSADEDNELSNDGGRRLRSLGVFRTIHMNHKSQYHWEWSASLGS
jgi:hypothetical protein